MTGSQSVRIRIIRKRHETLHATSSAPVSNPPKGSRWAVWLATGFGAGYLPIMPGTYGSAEGLVLYVGLAHLFRDMSQGRLLLCATVVLTTLLSLGIIALALPHFSSDDPSAIVIDEIAGQAITLLALAFLSPDLVTGWFGLLVGFILFRAFDTLKPYPIWKMGYWKGAVGVLADDVGAAIVAAAILYGLSRLGWV
jgi:phosphatidylglycerophosphatase A